MKQPFDYATEDERQMLLRDCHSLVAQLGHHTYAIKLLRAARGGLLLYLSYKSKG